MSLFSNTNMAPSHTTPKKEEEDDDVQVCQAGPSRCSTKPLPNKLELVQIKVGSKVYAPEKSSLDPWYPAKVILSYDHCGRRLMKVEFLPEDGLKPVYKTRARSKVTTKVRSLSFKFLAYYEEAQKESLPVGVRVIAQAVILVNKPCTFYSGIVADTPKPTNKHRYLIFFDSGDARYIDPPNVRLICKYEAPVWADMHPNHQMFIKKYIEDYPDNVMTTLRQAAYTTVEFNGCWWPARVLEIDCFLVKLQFIQNDISFWVYRGSPRLLSNFVKTKKEALVPCTYFQEYEGKVVNHTVPEKYKKLGVLDGIPIPPHTCGPACSRPFPGDLTELDKVSPLVIPFYYGWKRDIKKNDQARPVFYKTPCGKELKNEEEIHNYIMKTESPLEIDSFSFDFLINCYAEFQNTRPPLFREPDISNGKEKPGVERINCVDNVLPRQFDYISNTNPGKVNTHADDPDFLICCDCVDDCRDKKNCPCFMLTFESDPDNWNRVHEIKDFDPHGYQNRRLKEKYVAGIYECNSKCKCKKSCFNRVVQNGVKFKLQIFKTVKKGYAIRAMQDIPAGSFLCAYAGYLMDSDQANQEGTQYGDEYLANLDLIESFFHSKPDQEDTLYEPECQEAQKSKKGSKTYGIEKNGPQIDQLSMSQLKLSDQTKGLNTARKSTSSISKRKLDDDKNDDDDEDDEVKILTPAMRFREFFRPQGGREEDIYTIDARKIGNLSRYMNHSCNPNTFTQNVFVESHDLRFPVVAFFTDKFIKCGTELGWNYNYEVGTVEGKKIDCNCGAVDCRGRLL